MLTLLGQGLQMLLVLADQICDYLLMHTVANISQQVLLRYVHLEALDWASLFINGVKCLFVIADIPSCFYFHERSLVVLVLRGDAYDATLDRGLA